MLPCKCGRMNKSGTTQCLCGQELLVKAKLKKPSIKKVSDKRSVLNDLYSWIRIVWLTQNSFCTYKGCTCAASEIHHVRRKIGFADQWAKDNNIPLLIDYRFFMSVCRDHHTWIEDNFDLSCKMGYSIPVNKIRQIE